MVLIKIKPLNIEISIALQNSILLSDLYISVRDYYKLQNNIEEWICFSETRKEKLNNNDILDEYSDEKLIIFIYSSNKLIENQSNQNQEITLFLNIDYDSRNRTIKRVFKNTTIFQDLKELALAECSLLFQDCQIDIKYFGQTLQQQSLDTMIIKQMMLRENATLDIIITQNSGEENKILAILQNMSEQQNQIQENIYKHFENIIFKVDIILRNTFDQMNQLLQQIETNIVLAQNNIKYLKDLNQIQNISDQLNNINIYMTNIEILTNKYTERIILDQQQILSRYNNSSIPLSMPKTATIREAINYLQLLDINYESQLRFSNNLINQLDIDEQIQNFVNHTLYIDFLKIEINQLDQNQQMKQVQVFY